MANQREERREISAVKDQQMKEAAEKSARSVFVGNIPYEASDDELKDIFGQAGPVLSFRLVYDRETGKPKGYGFCEYKDTETAQSAMRNLNGTELHGRQLRVDSAASQKGANDDPAFKSNAYMKEISPYGAPVAPAKAPETITSAVASLPPEQMFELMKQMKLCIQNNPEEARHMLLQNPQLAYALLQAQVIMKIVDPKVADAILHQPRGEPLPIKQLMEQAGIGPNSGAPPAPTHDQNPRQTQAPLNMLPGPPIPPGLPIPPGGLPGAPMPPRPEMWRDGPPRDAPGMPPHPNQMFPGLPRDDRGPMPPNEMRPDFGRPPQMGNDNRGNMQPGMDREFRGPPDDRFQDGRGPPNVPGGPGGPGGPHPGPFNQPPAMDNQMGHMRRDEEMRPGPPMFDDRMPRVSDERVQDMRASMGMQPGNDMRGPQPQDMRDPRAPLPPDTRDPRFRPQGMGQDGPPVGHPPPPNQHNRPPTSGSGNMPQFPPALAGLTGPSGPNGPTEEEKARLIMQVLNLTEEQIRMLPEEQRESIRLLKNQIAQSQR